VSHFVSQHFLQRSARFATVFSPEGATGWTLQHAPHTVQPSSGVQTNGLLSAANNPSSART
jgi:hypothetical protein